MWRNDETETHVFGRGDAPRVVDADIPLVEGGDGPRRLALFLRQAVVLKVADRAARELEYPRCESEDGRSVRLDIDGGGRTGTYCSRWVCLRTP